MPNVSQAQPDPRLIGAKITPDFHRKVRLAAAARDMSLSDVVRQALRQWMTTDLCPLCDFPTIPHPDPLMTDVRYCANCEQAVSLDQSAQAAQ